MRVLLTGPFGTIGTRVLNELLARKHNVSCFDLDNKTNRKISRRYNGRINMIWGDITDAASVNAAVANQDAIIHLAAIIPMLSETNPELAEKVNVQGTQIVIDAIAAQATKPLLVFPSSISVHGFSNNRVPPCRVDTPMDARDHYAGHKIECEKRLRASNIPWVILRIGACSDALNQKTGDIETMMRHMFTLDVDTRIEYLHPHDAALAMTNAIDNAAAVIGKTLFLGSGKSSQTSWLEFINIVPRAMGVGDLPASAFGSEPYYTDWMDTTESQQLLNFQQLGLDGYKRELAQQWRLRRVLLWPFRGLIRRYMLKFSAQKN
ncbi:MAG TPA: NAD(P)-dependent oxidoreductase [Pseudomonadales bacterium]|nr:NAD(P)-dependent oxidoreductase [Pseudomonadales bacterium]